MAWADMNILTDTWWTTGSSVGLGDGSSLANRQHIPTDIGFLYAYAKLYVVLETADGNILIGNNEVANKQLRVYGSGGLYTIAPDGTVESLLNADGTVVVGTPNLYIGGSAAFTEGSKTLYTDNVICINTHWGQDTAGNAVCNTSSGFRTEGGLFISNTMKTLNTFNLTPIAGHFKNCTIHGDVNGTGYCIRFATTPYFFTLEDCEMITSYPRILLNSGSIYNPSIMNIIGTLTIGGGSLGQIRVESGGEIKINHYKRAYLQTSVGSVYFGAKEATLENLETYKTDGLSGATGLAIPPSLLVKASPCIRCILKVEKYTNTGTFDYGTPTTTDTFGNYTFFFMKSGYTPLTQIHDFADGNDWGTIVVPIEITMVPTTTHFDAAGGLWGDVSFPDIWKNIRRVTAYPSTLTTYDFLIAADAAFVVPTGGLTVYLYDYDGILIDTPYVSTAPINLSGGGVYESLTGLTGIKQFTTPATAGKYKMVVEIYDPARPSDYLWEEEWIEVLASVKAVFATDYFLYSVDNATGAIPTPSYVQGETLRLAGQITLNGADTVDNDVDILLYKADGTLVETIPTSQFSSSDGVTQDLDTILGTIFTKDTSLLDPGDYYYLMDISGSDLEESLQIIAAFRVTLTIVTTPVIYDVTMTQASISQTGSTTIRFKATNMTATDFSYIEVVGKGIIKKCTTTDNLNYVLTLQGNILPVMTSNMLRIVAINVGGSDADESLYLTVTETITSVEYFRKEGITIPDTTELVRQLFIDDLRNHLLKHLVPHDKIITHFEGTWPELPAILIREIEMIPIMTEEAIPGGVGSKWHSTIQIDLVTSDDSYCNYPPASAGELDSEDTRYDGAEKVLNVIKWIIFRILAENKMGYESDTIPTFMWDDHEFIAATFIDGGYNGNGDISAIEMTYRFEFEMVSRSG